MPDRCMPRGWPLATTALTMTVALLAACASDAPEPEAMAEAPPRAAPPVTAETGDGLGLSQAELLQVFAANGLDPKAFEMQALGDGREVLTASYPPTTERQVLFVALFGGEQAPHTVRMDYFPLNARGDEGPRVGQTLDGLMQALFPDWAEGRAWPETAGQKAWQETMQVAEAAREGAAESLQVPIFETDHEGVSLSALSIPPAVVSYVVTTKDSCRPANPEARYNAGYVGCG
jgi:hypothetical protein